MTSTTSREAGAGVRRGPTLPHAPGHSGAAHPERLLGPDEVREAVPGLGEVTWPRSRRISHASRLLQVHRPDRRPVAFRWALSPISFPRRRCARCGDEWICAYAAWAKAARRQEVWREWP